MTTWALILIIAGIFIGLIKAFDLIVDEHLGPVVALPEPEPLPELGKCNHCEQRATLVKFDGELLNLCRACAEYSTGELLA